MSDDEVNPSISEDVNPSISEDVNPRRRPDNGPIMSYETFRNCICVIMVGVALGVCVGSYGLINHVRAIVLAESRIELDECKASSAIPGSKMPYTEVSMRFAPKYMITAHSYTNGCFTAWLKNVSDPYSRAKKVQYVYKQASALFTNSRCFSREKCHIKDS
jgi:hypothetical protein